MNVFDKLTNLNLKKKIFLGRRVGGAGLVSKHEQNVGVIAHTS